MKSFLLWWFISNFVLIIKCTDIEEGDIIKDLKEGYYSSDEEDSRDGDSTADKAEFREALENVNFDEESSEYQLKKAHKRQSTGLGGYRPLSCLDGTGDEVDWWVVLKEPNGLRYLYYSSKDVGKRPEFRPLNPNFLLNDPETSPVLKTIYHSGNRDPSEVWFGWNDQPHDGRDAYGANVCGTKHAHSKGFYAQNAVFHPPQNGEKVTIGAYTILTSLPRFPVTETVTPVNYGAAQKNRLPRNQSDIFGSNLNTNGQHFICLNFPRHRATLEKFNNFYEVPLFTTTSFKQPQHINFLTKYLKTIHPAIIGTNFEDQLASHYIWRRYFSHLKLPFPVAEYYLNNSCANQKLLAYSKESLPSKLNAEKNTNTSTSTMNININIFPLSSSPFYINEKGRVIFDQDASSFKSRWEPNYASQNGCIDGRQSACLASFSFTTTGLQSPLELQLFAKHGLLVMDLYDDWAALQLVQNQTKSEGYFTGQVVDRYGLLVQSWFDSKTSLPRRPDKKIFNPETWKLSATVHIDNVGEFSLPTFNDGTHLTTTRIEEASHKDHSKWAIGFAMDTFNHEYTDEDEGLAKQEYGFKPLIFFSDLNRANTQIQLKDKAQGRGGGIVAIGSTSLWTTMMKLKPRAQKSKCLNKNKNKARALQKNLMKHTKSIASLASSLPVRELRSTLFKTLRLSKIESRNHKKAVEFVPVLSEISKFLKMIEFESEHVAMTAFKRLFHQFSEGKVNGAAKLSLKATQQRLIEQEGTELEYSSLLRWPKFMGLPAIQMYRKITSDSQEDDEEPKILRCKEDDSITTVNSIESLSHQLMRLKESKEVQTTETSTCESSVQTEYELVGSLERAMRELEIDERTEENENFEEASEEYDENDYISDEFDSSYGSDKNDSGSDVDDSHRRYKDSDSDSNASSSVQDTEYAEIMLKEWDENEGYELDDKGNEDY